MTGPDVNDEGPITLVDVRLQLLAFLANAWFLEHNGNWVDGNTVGVAADIAAAAKVLEDYVLDIVDEPEPSS